MRKNLLALLVHGHPEPFESLTRTLRDLSVETYSVESCKETEDLISHGKPPIIFTEESLVDGSWVSILNIADSTDVPLSVIVVGDVPDIHQYLSVMERGAFDFVTPPFEHEPLNFVIRSAALDAYRRRQALKNYFAARGEPTLVPESVQALARCRLLLSRFDLERSTRCNANAPSKNH